MAAKGREPKLVQEIAAGTYRFAWEEYWEEDDSGFCCVDYVLEKHSRLKVFDKQTNTCLREYPFDSGMYEKDLLIDGDKVLVYYHKDFDQKVLVMLDCVTLEICGEIKL